MLARRVPLLVLTTFFSVALWSQTNTAAGAGTYPALPQPNSTANLGVRPEVLPWDTGEAGLHLLAKKLKNTGRIMHLTAHPDDEDGALLTYLARGQGRQVLLMSLTRGEGGQNRTGSNLWDELGVLRTLELLESTRYYGTELRFSRVADFGFSKSADETFQKWGGHQVPLRDIVYVIREWKPDVLFTRFSGTPRDGHGMHQASAILAPEAVKCAADPNCFPDQLKGDHALTTWQVLKLYMGNQGGEYPVRYDVSQIDPDTKLSYTQMALEGFKHQASQLSGNFTPPAGPNWRSYKLISTSIPNYKAEKEQDFFDGIDTTLTGLPKRFPEARELGRVSEKIADVSRTLDSSLQLSPVQILHLEDEIHDVFVDGMPNDLTALRKSQVALRLYDKTVQMERFSTLALGLIGTGGAPSQFVSPGQSVSVSTQIENGGKQPIEAEDPVVGSRLFRFPLGIPVAVNARTLQPGARINEQKKLDLPEGMPLTQQHWHRSNPERDTVYRVDAEAMATLPLVAPDFFVGFSYKVGELKGDARLGDVLWTGDHKTKLAIAPPVALLFDEIQRVQRSNTFDTTLSIRNVTVPRGDATVSLTVPSGWRVTPASVPVHFEKPNDPKQVKFNVVPVQKLGTFEIKATAEFSGKKYDSGFSTVTRPDLDTFYYYQPAIQRVSIVDVNVPKNLRIGYIPGAGDDIFPVLQQLGLNARQISNDELAQGDLHQYDTIVVGIRGYDERREIRANNQRLLNFVNDGGTLLVQNQKAEDVFNSGNFTPYPATLGRERVSVEEAPVTVLAPNDSVFNSPNKITQADFDGWVQERGINFMSTWDSKYEPLLACNDPGEQPLKGGLLRAKYGKGTYIYTGYAFFRQLPAGVPGAVRLYVNLLNAGHEGK